MDYQPDIISVGGFGCSEYLLDMVEQCGGARLVMSRAQYDYILENMTQNESGKWTRKPRA